MRCYLLLPALLATSLVAHAQQALPAAAYQAQHDSLEARAQRIRAQTAARTEVFKTSFAGLGGTRRATSSLGRLRARPVTDTGSRLVEVKREVVKHKTHGAEIKKVYYYGPAGQQLYEYYEGGRLVRLDLANYPVAGEAGGSAFCTMRWVSGDYLVVSLRSRAIGGHQLARRYYAHPVTSPH